MVYGVGSVNFVIGWVDRDRLVPLLQKHLLYDAFASSLSPRSTYTSFLSLDFSCYYHRNVQASQDSSEPEGLHVPPASILVVAFLAFRDNDGEQQLQQHC
jgi:hypothetical protein